MVHSHHPAGIEAASKLRVCRDASEEVSGEVSVDAEGDDVLVGSAPVCHRSAIGEVLCRRSLLQAVSPLAGTSQRPVSGSLDQLRRMYAILSQQ